MKTRYLILTLVLVTSGVHADDTTVDAAIGGGLGGAAGAVIGHEVGGREGAIIGGAIGAGIGVAIATDEDEAAAIARRRYEGEEFYEVEYEPLGNHHQPRIPPGHRPPPGQCRIWYPGRPPGHQPPPGNCRGLGQRMPAGTWLVRG